MSENSIISRYKVSLAGLCHYCARLAHLRQLKADGEVVDEGEVCMICSLMEQGVDEFLSLKSELGFDDGLQFMEDNLFAGFCVRNGVVEGELSNVLAIAEPWYENFPEKGNNYQFEVANYLFAFLEQSADMPKPENMWSRLCGKLHRLFRKTE